MTEGRPAPKEALNKFRRTVAGIRRTFLKKTEGAYHKIEEKRVEKLKRLISGQQ